MMGSFSVFGRDRGHKQQGTNSVSIIPLLFFLLPAMVSGVAAADECIISADGVKFDFAPLKGPSSVTVSRITPPTVCKYR